MSEMLLKVVDFKTETAIDGLRRIDETGDFDRRGDDTYAGHPLWLLRSGNMTELSRRIWEAQIQVLFPIIELERQQLVEKWYAAIDEALADNAVVQYGSTLTDPAEVELGTLCYMLSCKVSGDHRMLYLPDEEDRERIHFLHECRNKLAHMSCCAPSEVTTLLDKTM